jgi:hypothetical protein
MKIKNSFLNALVGIAAEVGYALCIMAAALVICWLLAPPEKTAPRVAGYERESQCRK